MYVYSYGGISSVGCSRSCATGSLDFLSLFFSNYFFSPFVFSRSLFTLAYARAEFFFALRVSRIVYIIYVCILYRYFFFSSCLSFFFVPDLYRLLFGSFDVAKRIVDIREQADRIDPGRSKSTREIIALSLHCSMNRCATNVSRRNKTRIKTVPREASSVRMHFFV